MKYLILIFLFSVMANAAEIRFKDMDTKEIKTFGLHNDTTYNVFGLKCKGFVLDFPTLQCKVKDVIVLLTHDSVSSINNVMITISKEQ
jgi:hypothetical protein